VSAPPARGADARPASEATTAAFAAHVEEARDIPDEARAAGKLSQTEGRERLSFPSAIFIGKSGERHGVWGFQPAEAYREAALAAGATQTNRGPLTPLDAPQPTPSSGTTPSKAACARPEP